MGNEDLVYRQVCESYHAIDDFRTKLLGLLPLASGAGIFLLLSDAFTESVERTGYADRFLLSIGLFGYAVTLGLFVYELRGIDKCIYLMHVGEGIERNDLKLQEGQFLKLHTHKFSWISKPLAASIIYPAVLLAWVYMAYLSQCQFEWWIAVLVFLSIILALVPVRYQKWVEKNYLPILRELRKADGGKESTADIEGAAEG